MTSNNTWYLYLHVRVVTIDDAIWWWNKSLILKRDFGILVIMNYSLPSWIEEYFRNEYSWVFILDWWTIRDLLANENVYLKIWIFHLDFFFFELFSWKRGIGKCLRWMFHDEINSWLKYFNYRYNRYDSFEYLKVILYVSLFVKSFFI